MRCKAEGVTEAERRRIIDALARDPLAGDLVVGTVDAVRNWEQGRRTPEESARVLLKVIDREPEAVLRALG